MSVSRKYPGYWSGVTGLVLLVWLLLVGMVGRNLEGLRGSGGRLSHSTLERMA